MPRARAVLFSPLFPHVMNEFLSMEVAASSGGGILHGVDHWWRATHQNRHAAGWLAGCRGGCHHFSFWGASRCPRIATIAGSFRNETMLITELPSSEALITAARDTNSALGHVDLSAFLVTPRQQRC